MLKGYNPSLNKWGDPQILKGVEFYPILLREEDMYNKMLLLLGNPKSVNIDREVLKASYLTFLINVVYRFYKEDENFKEVDIDIHQELVDFISHITKKECRIEFEHRIKNPRTFNDTRFWIMIDDIKFSESDFESLREIILAQNGVAVSYIEEYHPDLERRLEQSAFGKIPASLEEQIFSFCSIMKMNINTVKEEYSFYQFKKHFERVNLLLDYEIYKPLESSGQIKLKEGEIQHWASHMKEKGRYEDILINKSEYMKKSDIFSVTKSS